jgi:predicted transcriptional regulator
MRVPIICLRPPTQRLDGRVSLGKIMSNSEELLTELTAEIVSAYVANNSVPPENLPELIARVHTAVAGHGATSAPEPPTPAVNRKRSVFPDYIISLEDGRKFKSMKRHLGLLGMTR